MYKLYKFKAVQKISEFNRTVFDLYSNNVNIFGGILLSTSIDPDGDKINCHFSGTDKFVIMKKSMFDEMFVSNEQNNLSGNYICRSSLYREKLNYDSEVKQIKVVKHNPGNLGTHVTIANFDSSGNLLMSETEFQAVFRRVSDTYVSEKEPEISGFVKSINLEITSEEQRLNAIEILQKMKF